VSHKDEQLGLLQLTEMPTIDKGKERRPALQSLVVDLVNTRSVTDVLSSGYMSVRQATQFSFYVAGFAKAFPETPLPELQITLPGDIREQIMSYCEERRELSVGLCYQLIGYVTERLSSGHVPSKPLRNLHCATPGYTGCRRNGVKVAIVHLATENAHWSASHAQAINLFYSRRHSYDFISLACPELTGGEHEEYLWSGTWDQVRANWAKPKILLDHLQRYDYVLLLDSDAYISEPSITVEEIADRHMNEGKTVLVPNNCFAVTKGDPDTVSSV
jgi:hypothetical protein